MPLAAGLAPPLARIIPTVRSTPCELPEIEPVDLGKREDS
jgi:hypothetical protein